MIKWFYKISNTPFKQMFGETGGNLSYLNQEWICHKKITFNKNLFIKGNPVQSTGFLFVLAF